MSAPAPPAPPTAPLVSPTLEEARRRYAAARQRARSLVAGLDEAAFHHAPAAGSWSVAECLEHLVVSGGKIATKLEAATTQARAAGRVVTGETARMPVRLGWFARVFIAGTGPVVAGARFVMKVSTRPPFDPDDPRGRGRTRDAVLGDFLALQERLDVLARAADGLDLSGVKVGSVLADWIRIPLGAWFIAVAGHQERHLDQAARARAVSAAPQALGEHMLADAVARFHELKGLGDRAMAQVDDTAFFTASDPEANSIALVVKHVAGNLRSRWRNFLVEDGEKPDRDRDSEFERGEADTRAALLARWEEGWAILFAELGALAGSDLLRTVTIRHEPHTVVQCIHRQLTHYGYHVGQIVLLARRAQGAAWTSLSIPRRKSGEFNTKMKDRFDERT